MKKESSKKHVRLYNLIFPVWALLLFPPLWLISLPANFIIDFLVLFLAMRHLQIAERTALCKKSIIPVWIAGFACDFVGAGMMFLWNIFDVFSADFTNAVDYNPFSRPDAFLWTVLCMALTGVLIYFVNKKLCLAKLPVTDRQRHQLSLALAVFTAPYLFLLPTEWFF